MQDPTSLAATLQRHLERRGWSPERLVTVSGVPKATVYRWVRGDAPKPYHWNHLLRLAAALELTRAQTNQLLRAAGMATLDRLAAGTLAPDERRLVERWSAAPFHMPPATLTSFIGRDDEVIELSALLCEEQPRLVTLTGPGGSGKTRLALRVAGELLDAFPDGVFFVPLAAADEPADVPPAIVRALRIADVAGLDHLERLAAYLRQRLVLLLLDNLEQVVSAGAHIADLLERAPGVKALVTSRVALRVYGEQLWPVEPLAQPEPGSVASRVPVIQLFEARALAANPRFRLRPQLSSVTALCARLDGLPLAIELAAARSAHFTPAELLSVFPNRLDLGADGPLNVDARQRTLRDTIAWSFHLLTSAEQRLFTRLAVFEGGWTAEAAARVCAAGQTVSEELATLHGASLIVNDGGARPRWRMLETIREYLTERAARDADVDELHGQHARYYLALAESLPAYSGTRDGRVVTALDLEYDNLRAALRWLLTHDRAAALRLSGALWPYWIETGRLAEGDRWLRATLEPNVALPAAPRARALAGLTVVSSSLGNYAAALALSERALALATDVGDLASLASVETCRGLMAQHGGDLGAGEGWCQRALGHWRAANAPLGEARCHSELALIAAMGADWVAWQEHIDAAEALYTREQEAGGLARSLNDRGFVAMAQGDYPRAIELLLEGVAQARENTFNFTHGGGLLYLGLAQQFAGQIDDARRNLSEALRAFSDAGDMLFISYCLIGFAGSESLLGRPVRAAELCGAGLAAQAAVGLVMPPMVRKLYEAGVSTIRAQIDDATFAAAFERGRQLPIQEAVAYALADSVPAS